MSRIFNSYSSWKVYIRSYVSVVSRNICKWCNNIKISNGFCGFLNSFKIIRNRLSDIVKKVVFKCNRSVFCTEDSALYIFQILSNISFTIGKCLLSYVCFGYHGFIRIWYFNIISEYPVITDFKLRNSRYITLFSLNTGKNSLWVIHISCHGIKFFVITSLNHTALTDCKRGFFNDCRINKRMNVLKLINAFINIFKIDWFAIKEQIRNLRKILNCSAEWTQISCICRTVNDSCHKSFNVKYTRECVCNIHTEHIIVYKLFNRTLTVVNWSYIKQRMFKPWTHKAFAHCGFCLVKHPQKW